MNSELNFELLDKMANMILKTFEECKVLKRKIDYKELNDIVTETDKYIEEKIVSYIQAEFPKHSIYSEECGENNKNSEYKWLIDPIDGTINFSTNIPLFATSVALSKNDEIILGLIIDYSQNDIYTCIKGKGAFKNNKPIKVSNTNTLKDSIVSFCLTSHYNEKHIDEVLKIEKCLASKVRGLRLIVSAAIELAWCATGKLEGVLNVKPSIGLSSAAGKLLVQEAGGKVTNLDGNSRDKVDTLLVTNGIIHDEIVNELKNITYN